MGRARTDVASRTHRAPRQHSLRSIVNALLYGLRTGRAWHLLPADCPPWQGVLAKGVVSVNAYGVQGGTPFLLAVRVYKPQTRLKSGDAFKSKPGWRLT